MLNSSTHPRHNGREAFTHPGWPGGILELFMSHWIAQGTNLLVLDTATVFAAGLVFALLARRLHQSLLLGYLIAGLVIGPHMLGLVSSLANIRFLADVGVVLLMFALGVQLSLRHFLEVRTTALFVGLLQSILIIFIGLMIGIALGFSPFAGLIIGYAAAVSSSVILVRLLTDLDATQTLYGRIGLGISVVQDLLAVVLMSTLPFMVSAASASFSVILIDLLKALLFVLWIIILARWVAPIILRWASATGSREIFLLTVVVLSLAGAILSFLFGFSFALGAFLAGLVISGSMFSQAVLAEVIPLRDLFGLLFFISLGMLVDPMVLWHSWGLVLALLCLAIIVKGGIILLLMLVMKHHAFTALLTAVSLAQIGEFSFIISREAARTGIITSTLNSAILAVAILSIALTPLLLQLVRWSYCRLRLAEKVQPMDEEAQEDMVLAEEKPAPVLLCGYGRVGRTIAQALDTFRVPFTVVDIDRRAIQNLHRRNIHAIYGDATNLHLLERINAKRFSLGVIAVAGGDAVYLIALHLRELNPAMRLLLRAQTDEETAYYLQQGIEGVVHVELEASLSFVREVLTTADVDPEIVDAYLEDIRLGYYEGLQPRPREE